MYQTELPARSPPNRPQSPTSSEWELARFEIRATLTRDQWPLARVEINHARRGRLVELAWGRGPLECVFVAIAQILGVEGRIRSLDIRYVAAPTGAFADPSDETPHVTATVVVAVEDRCYRGSASSDDVIKVCALAFLDALAQAAGPGGLPAGTVARCRHTCSL